jgi:TRAP-type C4-dicarboxylate transport system substrate-binding protein
MANTERAPRGTKPVAQAFLGALEKIPAASQAAVAKAALTAVREELAARKEKARDAKAKAKAKGAPVKVSAKGTKKPTARKDAAKAPAKVPAKKMVRRARKVAPAADTAE